MILPTVSKDIHLTSSQIIGRNMRLAKINVDESKTSPIKGGLLSQQVPSTLPAEGTGFLTAFARTILGDRGTLQRNPSVIASPTLPEQFDLEIIHCFSSENRVFHEVIKSAELETRKKLVEEQIMVFVRD